MGTEKIIQRIKDSYHINIIKMRVLRDGPDNVIWDAESDKGDRYAIRVSKRDIGEDIAFEAEWIRILHSEGVPVVPIVLTKNGESYVHITDGQVVTVFNFLNGKHFSASINNPPPQKAVKTAAQALAKLHAVSEKHKINLPRKRTIFTELERVIKNQDLILEKMPGGKEFITKVNEMLEWGRLQTYNTVLIHNDYRISNIMFDNKDNLLAMLDFDWSCLGPAIKDVTHSLAEWSFPDGATKHNEEIFSTFLQSYNQTNITTISRDNFLYRWMALSCLSDACTFLVDRLLRGEIKQPYCSYMYKKYQYFLSMK